MARKPSKDGPALTHIDSKGEARMVDVSAKPATERMAIAEGRVGMRKATLGLVVSGNSKKGDVLGTARLAGIMAAKRTSDLIPLCHPLALLKVTVEIAPNEKLPGCIVRATVKVSGPTGVETEALTAVSVACLTIYDMVKAADRAMRMDARRLLSKSGGRSGVYEARTRGHEPAAGRGGARPGPRRHRPAGRGRERGDRRRPRANARRRRRRAPHPAALRRLGDGRLRRAGGRRRRGAGAPRGDRPQRRRRRLL